VTACWAAGGRQQLEYLVQRVQLVLLAMQSSMVATRSPVQLQELAAVILNVLQAAHSCQVGYQARLAAAGRLDAAGTPGCPRPGDVAIGSRMGWG
jgi:hypothetical protein